MNGRRSTKWALLTRLIYAGLRDSKRRFSDSPHPLHLEKSLLSIFIDSADHMSRTYKVPERDRHLLACDNGLLTVLIYERMALRE